METIGNRIAFLRKQKGLTQEELSEKAGINLRTLQRIEKDETEPRSATLRMFCDTLHIPLEDLIDFGKTENRNLLIYLHLSVLSGLFIPMGQILLPFILWITQRDKIKDSYSQGANIINFQLWVTALLYGTIICTFLFGSRIFSGMFIPVLFPFIIFVIWPVINALRIYKGTEMKPFYPWIIRIIK